jgi:excisionase family DNA binding protein
MNASEQVVTKGTATAALGEAPEKERLAYTLLEVADMIGVDYLSVYRLIQRGKLKACRALRGKFLVTRSELLRMLNKE